MSQPVQLGGGLQLLGFQLELLGLQQANAYVFERDGQQERERPQPEVRHALREAEQEHAAELERLGGAELQAHVGERDGQRVEHEAGAEADAGTDEQAEQQQPRALVRGLLRAVEERGEREPLQRQLEDHERQRRPEARGVAVDGEPTQVRQQRQHERHRHRHAESSRAIHRGRHQRKS